MSLQDFLDDINEEVETIHSPKFKIDVTATSFVPNDSDSSLTFENFDDKYKKVKTIETCVLYIDIRKSTELNLQHFPKTMTKLYSSFVRSMIRAAEYYDGKIRNIIGDRVMVVFDENTCFKNAVNTAILMNTISQKILNVHFTKNVVNCGIGIDFGKMMVAKCGTIKHGDENSLYKSLVWLGQPANIASKLTDCANKHATTYTVSGLNVGLHYRNIDEWTWKFQTPKDFVDSIVFDYLRPIMTYKDEHFSSCFAATENRSNYDSTPPILMTEVVFDGFKSECPDDTSISNKWWKKQSRKIPNYSGTIFGGDVTFIWENK